MQHLRYAQREKSRKGDCQGEGDIKEQKVKDREDDAHHQEKEINDKSIWKKNEIPEPVTTQFGDASFIVTIPSDFAVISRS